jgi:rubredoxin
MSKWQCIPCGYVYDPEKGDTDNDVPPGTSWAELTEDWRCPVCGAEKWQFEELKS